MATILLLHGWQGAYKNFGALPQILEAEGHQVLPFFRDFNTRRLNVTLEDLADELQAEFQREFKRISSPPVKWPCFYGIDMANRRELIAARKTIAEIEEEIGADSLGYLSLRGVLNAVGLPRESFCHACFTGDYPIEIPRDVKLNKLVLEEPALVG